MERYLIVVLQRLDRKAIEPILFLHTTSDSPREQLLQTFADLRVPVFEIDQRGVPVIETNGHDQSHRRKTPQAEASVQTASGFGSAITVAKTLWWYWACIRRTARSLRPHRLDAVHFVAGWFPCFELAVLGSQLAGIPVRLVDVIQEPYDLALLEPERRWIVRLAGRSATHVRAMNQQMRRQLETQYGIAARKVHVLKGVIDLERFFESDNSPASDVRTSLGLSLDARLVATLGRLGEYKGNDLFLQAIQALQERFPQVHYLIIGDGPLRHELQAQASQLGLSRQVHFLGWHDDIPLLLRAADLFVMPSMKEGGPYVVVEAMASGTPVIATDVGFVREVMQERTTGRIVRSGSVEDLVAAMTDLLEADPSVLKRMGLAAREHVRTTILPEPWFERLLSIYSRITPGVS